MPILQDLRNKIFELEEKNLRLSVDNENLKGHMEVIKKQIPPFEVYQALRFLCLMYCSTRGANFYPLETSISRQHKSPGTGMEKGLKWMIENNPQEEI